MYSRSIVVEPEWFELEKLKNGSLCFEPSDRHHDTRFAADGPIGAFCRNRPANDVARNMISLKDTTHAKTVNMTFSLLSVPEQIESGLPNLNKSCS